MNDDEKQTWAYLDAATAAELLDAVKLWLGLSREFHSDIKRLVDIVPRLEERLANQMSKVDKHHKVLFEGNGDSLVSMSREARSDITELKGLLKSADGDNITLRTESVRGKWTVVGLAITALVTSVTAIVVAILTGKSP